MKKLLSLMLAVMMVLSLAACGKKAKTVTATLEAMNKMEPNKVNCEVVMKSDVEDVDLSVLFEAQKIDNKNMYMSFSAKGSVADYTIDKYTKVTDVYIENGKNIYVNAAAAMDFAIELDSQFALIAGMLDFPEDYFKISISEIAELMKQADVEISEKDIEAIFEAEADAKQQEKLIKILGEFLDKYIKEGKGNVGSVDNGMTTLKLSDKNAKDVLQALNAVDVEGFLKDVFKELESMDSSFDADEYLSEIEGINDDIKAELDNFDASDYEDMDMVVKFGVQDKKAIMNMSVKAEDATITMDITSVNEKIKAFDFPTASFGMDEVMNMIGNFF